MIKFDEEKGFGFVKPDKGDEDVFVHFSQLPRDYQRGGGSTLNPGDRVTFDLDIDPAKGKKCAKNLQVETGGGRGGPPAGTGRGVTGVVKNFEDEKGFGFLTQDNGGSDVFVHFSALPKNYQRGGDNSLAEGDRVMFDIEADDKKGGKLCAKNVQVLGGSGGGYGGDGRGGGSGKGGGKSGGGAEGGSRAIMSADRRKKLFDDRSASRSRSNKSRSRSSPRRPPSPPGYGGGQPDFHENQEQPPAASGGFEDAAGYSNTFSSVLGVEEYAGSGAEGAASGGDMGF